MIYIRFLKYALLFLIVTNSFGQERLNFKHLGVREGLSNGSIKSIMQDTDGFMWFGTIDGLNKYDGIIFKVYNFSKSNASSLSSDDVSCILQDSQGKMWIGTFGGGLNLYDKKSDRFTVYAAGSDIRGSISSNEIHVIYEDSKHQIWIGTENGLNRYYRKGDRFKVYTLNLENPYSISSKSVRAICEDSLGFLWIGTFGGGLNRFDVQEETFTHYKMDPYNSHSISSDFVLDIEPYHKFLLIGTNGGGLEIFDPATNRFNNFFQEYCNDFNDIRIVKDIFTDSQGIIWVGTDGQGLIKIIPSSDAAKTKGKVSRFIYSSQIKSSLGSNAIYKIFEDLQHNIWIGTAWSGISVIEHTQDNIEFFYSDIEGIEPSPVLSVYLDPDNHLWIGSDGKGLYRYDRISGEVSNFSSLSTKYTELDYIQVIFRDREENFWIGTYANGLVYFNPVTNAIKSFKNIPSDPTSISHNNVRSILQDERGNLWIATWGGGISFFNMLTQKFTNYLHNEENPGSISNNNVIALEKAANGKIWAGTFGGGLNLFDPLTGSSVVFTHQQNNPSSLSGNNILCLHKDKNENLWIGTWGSGLSRLNSIRQEFKRYDLEEGLVNNTITAIEEDKQGVIWLSSKKGICSLNPVTHEIKMLNISRDSRVNEFHINSSFSDPEGKIYFGGIEGLICFNPSRLSGIDQSLNVRFTGFELFNKEVPVGENSPLKKQITYLDRIILNHKESVFTIRFAALDFPYSDNCQYAVIMEGFEKKWREIGTQNTVTYTNLSPGKYLFKVRAKLLNSDWDKNFTQIAITVKPPMMKTWWAIGLYILLFIILLYAFQRYTLIWARLKHNLKLERINREQESYIHQLKLRFFTNISHELRTPLTLILDPLNNLIESAIGGSTIQRSLRIIKKNTDRLLQLINELLDFRKIELGKISIHAAEGNIVKFTKEIYLSFTEYARKNKIQYHFHSRQDIIPVWFDRLQMEKVIYNLLSNAFKFTPEEGNISVTVKKEDKKVIIVVKDNGPGIPEDQLPYVFERFYQYGKTVSETQSGFGIGLAVVHELVKRHGGHVAVESQFGKGSEFSVRLLLGKEHFTENDIAKDHRSSEQVETYRYPLFDNSPVENTTGEFAEIIGQTILIVEDNDDLRSYLKDNMAQLFNVIEAKNGREGIEKALEMIPDVIISDVMMPVTDGIELCRCLKTDMRSSHIPIILLTARTASFYRLEGFETGADDYLTKPFRINELKVRIRNILDNRKLLRERYMKEAILQPREVIITSPDDKFLMNLVDLIEKYIDQPELKVDLLVRELGMSHSVIYKKLKALTGQSLVEYIRDQRLKRAAQLLSQNKLTVTEICYQVGFTDRRYFSQVFKKKYKVTPSGYTEYQSSDQKQ